MNQKEKKRLLHDPWPVQSKEDQKRLLQAIKKAAKAGVFEYEENIGECSKCHG